jgi:ElaB/YqjD/DUF883 family membrane-anchored ribosome-binding protein
MNSNNNNEIQTQKIKRTICIGLGGTGRDVLMRIRRLIVDRYGDLTELPNVSFVHIDTDKAASGVSGLRTGNIYHGVDLSFRDAEKVSATMTRIEVNNFAEELKRRSVNYEGQPGVYDHISQWFPPHLLKDLKAIDEGAKGIRPVGRLAFFHNYRKIKTAIDTAEKRTRGHEANLIKKGLIVDRELSIFVVGSLCGGTGSGIFLDVAYCLRSAYGDKGAQIFGYLVISPELYGNTPSMNANTYAGLKELNYYATSGSKFEVCYDPQNLEYVREQRPPFEYVYLVSDRTAEDYRILEKSKLSNIIAQKITLDFAGELAPIITAQRDNFLQHMISLDEHPRPNVQRYLTFGLAQIYFPRDITVQVSFNRIKIKLIKFWMNGEGQSPDPQVLLERFLRTWYPEQGRKDGFIGKLQEATTDGNKNFSSALSNWKNKLENTISECKTQDDRRNIIQQLGRELREQFRKVQPGETESTRGVWLTNLKQVRLRLTEQLKQDIDRFLGDLLNPNQTDFSLTNSRAWLEALLTELNKLQRDLEEKVNSFGQMHRLEDLERKWKDAEQIINDLDSKSKLPFFGNNKNSKVQEEAKGIIGQFSNLIKHNFDFAIATEAIQIVQILQQHVHSLTIVASNFYNLLQNTQILYEKKESELNQLNVDEMSGEAIFAEADTEDCYQNLLPDRDRRSQLAAVSIKITQQIGFGDTLTSCLSQELIDEQQLQQEIDSIVDRLFGSRSLSNVQSAIKRFLENYSSSDRSVRLEQILQEAKPLLPLNISDPYFYNDSGKSLDVIGFKDSDRKEVSLFKTILTKDLGIRDSVFKPIQVEDEIIFVSEYAAFPLRLVNGLEPMRQHYLRLQNYGNAYLHNDYRTIFTDIIPPDAREMKELQDIFYPCLAFDLLKYNSNNRMFEFQYYDRLRDTQEITSLSPVWNEALEQLANRQDMAKALKEKLEGAIADIQTNLSRWEQYYLPKLRAFVSKVDNLPEDDPNYPYKTIVVGTRATISSSAKEGIINRFWRRMQEDYQQKYQQYQESVARSQSVSFGESQSLQEAQSQPSLPDTNSSQATNNSIAIETSSEINTKQSDSASIIDTDYIDSPQSTTKDSMTQLKELIEMKKQGYLSEEEFQKAKQNILG